MYNTRDTQNVLFMLLIGKGSGQQQAISSYVFEELQVLCGSVTVGGIGGVISISNPYGGQGRLHSRILKYWGLGL